MRVGILEGPELGFTSTMHEHNLYQSMINGELILVCCQVDDFATSTKNTSTAEKLITIVNQHATTSSKGIGTPSDQGICMWYNGLDIRQTRDYIKLSCETYINHVLQMHGWEKPGTCMSDHHNLVPITPDAATTLMQLVPGPMEDTPEHQAIELDVSFGNQQVLGELIYAYVVV